MSGFNAERGDQLIVETLPFESSLNSEPPKSTKPVTGTKPSKDPAWLEFINRYRGLAAPLAAWLSPGGVGKRDLPHEAPRSRSGRT